MLKHVVKLLTAELGICVVPLAARRILYGATGANVGGRVCLALTYKWGNHNSIDCELGPGARAAGRSGQPRCAASR